MPRGPSFPSFLLASLLIPVGAAGIVAGVGWIGARATASEPPSNEPADTTTATEPADAAAYGALLARHVHADGFVDYDALAEDRADLDAYVTALGNAPLPEDRDAKLATLINAYNAFMLQMVLDAWPIDDVLKDLDQPFEAKRFKLAGEEVSLNNVEHDRIRPNFEEPRIHWAVVCGAFSCPKLRDEAYAADTLDRQLQEQAQYVHNGPRYIAYDGGNTIQLTPLYDWYKGDFNGGEVLPYVAQYVPALKDRLDAGNPPTVEFLDYSWLVNDVKNRDKLPK